MEQCIDMPQGFDFASLKQTIFKDFLLQKSGRGEEIISKRYGEINIRITYRPELHSLTIRPENADEQQASPIIKDLVAEIFMLLFDKA